MMDSIASHYFEIPTYCPPPLANIFMRTAVVESLFSLIYDDVFTLYARKYTEDDAIHALKTNQYLTLSPAHLAIKQKFWLNMWTNDDGTPTLGMSGELPILSPPYHNAVLTLRALPRLVSLFFFLFPISFHSQSLFCFSPPPDGLFVFLFVLLPFSHLFYFRVV